MGNLEKVMGVGHADGGIVEATKETASHRDYFGDKKQFTGWGSKLTEGQMMLIGGVFNIRGIFDNFPKGMDTCPNEVFIWVTRKTKSFVGPSSFFGANGRGINLAKWMQKFKAWVQSLSESAMNRNII